MRLEVLRDQELEELERLKLEAAQPAVNAATLFTTTTIMAPLVPIGQSLRDTITKEPFISPIELMHIIEAKMKASSDLFVFQVTFSDFNYWFSKALNQFLVM